MNELDYHSRQKRIRFHWRRIFRWGLPIVSTGLLAAIWQPVLGRLFENQVPPLFYLLPVLISGTFGGLGPGILAALLTAPIIFNEYSNLANTNSGSVLRINTQFNLRVGAFLLISMVIAWLSGRTRDAVSAARSSAAEARRDRQLLDGMRDQLSLVIQLNLIGVLFLSAEGIISDANDSLLQMIGRTREDMAAGLLNWSAIMQGQASEKFLRTVSSAGISAPLETLCRRVDGTTLPILLRGGLLKSTSQIVAFVIDLTDQRSAEAQLKQSQHLLERLADATPDILLVFDLSTLRIEYVNHAVEDVLGHDPSKIQEVVGAPLSDFVHPDEITALVAFAARFDVENEGTVLETDCRMKKVEGDYRLMRIRAVSFERGPDGKCRKILGLLHDVTEQEAAQHALRENHERLEAAGRAKDQFLAALSHELRTPLNPVLGIVTMLEKNERLAPEIREDLHVIRRNVELEARLIDDLLDLTRITNNKMKLQRETTDAHDKVRHAVQICRDDLNTKGIELEIDLAAAECVAHADAARFQQVFWNLLKNAVKFTPAGGKITLRSINPDDKTWSLIVTDTGVGIQPAMLPRVFDAFEQAGRHLQFGGLGLGLAISKTIVELHGGRISARSDGPGRGATFRVDLPIIAGVKLRESPRPAIAAPVPRGLRVLLVEDHPDTAKVMERVLKAMGHTVFLAGDVQEAVHIINTQTYDLLISDIGLPDGTGFDVVRAARVKSPVPAIAVTGFGMDADIKRSREAGFDAHVTKPLDIHRLAELIASVTRPAPAQEEKLSAAKVPAA